MNHRPEVEARKADFASEYSHIWSTRLGNRLGIMTQRLEEIEDQLELLRDHARRQTEMIRTVDPDASEVPVHGSEYRAYEKEQRALLREIADQCGQLPTRVAVQTQAAPLTFGATLVEDEHGQFHPGSAMKAKRTWWLIRRGDDGSATYADDDSKLDLSTLTIYPDGSRVTYQASDEGSATVSYPADPLLPKLINTIGVNLARAMGLAGSVLPAVQDTYQDPVPAVEPAHNAHLVGPAADPVDEQRAEERIEPAPEPVDERLDRDAKMMARSVWLRGGERRHHLLQGIPHDTQQELLDYAAQQGWVTVSDDGVVAPGPVQPIDRMPAREPMRWIERVTSWGPGEGGDPRGRATHRAR